MNRSRVRSVRGFTVLEMLVGLSIVLILGAFCLGLMRWAVTSVTRSEDRLDAREHALLGLAAMREVLATAWAYRTDPDASMLTFASPGMRGVIVLDPARGSLSLREEGQPARDLIASGVKGFQAVSEYSGLIRVTLELDRADRIAGPAAGEDLALVDEIYLPTIGGRGQGQPWNPTLSVEDPQALVPSI